MSGVFYVYQTKTFGVTAWVDLSPCSYSFNIELTIGNLNFSMGEDCDFGFIFQNILTKDIPSSVLYSNNVLVISHRKSQWLFFSLTDGSLNRYRNKNWEFMVFCDPIIVYSVLPVFLARSWPIPKTLPAWAHYGLKNEQHNNSRRKWLKFK